MFWSADSCLIGLKLLDRANRVLLAVGSIDDPGFVADKDWPVQEFQLGDNERIVGVKSG